MLIIRKCHFPYCTEIFLTEHYDLETKYHSEECSMEHMKYSVRGYKFDFDERAKEASRIKDEKCRNGVKSKRMESLELANDVSQW